MCGQDPFAKNHGDYQKSENGIPPGFRPFKLTHPIVVRQAAICAIANPSAIAESRRPLAGARSGLGTIAARRREARTDPGCEQHQKVVGAVSQEGRSLYEKDATHAPHGAVAMRKNQGGAQSQAGKQQHQGLVQRLACGPGAERQYARNCGYQRRDETDDANVPPVKGDDQSRDPRNARPQYSRP